MKTIKTFTFFFLFVALAGLLTACSAGTPELKGDAREAVLAYAEPIADNLLTGMREGNYQQFNRDFDEKMMEAISQNEFEALTKQLGDRIGSYQSREVLQVIDYGKVVTVVYRGKFEKADNVQILLTLAKQEPHQVSGLYFK